ncbi:MAG: flagellar hook capping FlgD N-terminal domain-containing protein [Sneathiella sp.]|uniref:flagellar hook assembly protein FlgD n=1 Tax=Sneathiella sp. TaxID=1964365 RepID=UPI00300298BA
MTIAEINAGLGLVNSAANTASTNLASNFDDFLTLLTTQLTNQDPLNPTDSNEFTNQLVNFTNVEQNIATNQNLEALLQLQQLNQQNGTASAMINYLGKTVGSYLNVAALDETGASWNIDLGSGAASVEYEVYDVNGTKVYSEEASGASAGAQVFSWDGEQTSGATAGNGQYYLVVKAESAGGNTVDVSYNFEGEAESMETVNGKPVLKVGGVYLTLEQITTVSVTNNNNSPA